MRLEVQPIRLADGRISMTVKPEVSSLDFANGLKQASFNVPAVKTRRAELHDAIAKAIEQQFPEIVQTQPETLAHHLTEAGLTERAIGYWLRAGKNAALRSSSLRRMRTSQT